MNRNNCQKRPRSMYSQPWWPNQKLYLSPSFCITADPLAGERADHDDQQADEQEVHAEPLEFRLVARDRRRDVQAGGKPRGGDPQHGELGMPGARQRVRQELARSQNRRNHAFHLVVRSDRAEQDLGQEQRQHDPEILGRGLHRGRQLEPEQRICNRRRDRQLLAVIRRVVPGEQAMPAIMNSTLNTVQMKVLDVGVLPTSGS